MTAMTAAIVTSATVVTASMLLTVMIVVIAFCVWVVGKRSSNISSNGIICVSADTAEQLDACLSKGHLCTTADTAAY